MDKTWKKRKKPPGLEVKVNESKRKIKLKTDLTDSYRSEQQNHKQTTLQPYYL